MAAAVFAELFTGSILQKLDNPLADKVSGKPAYQRGFNEQNKDGQVSAAL